jgi:hypothetical protein
MNTKRFVTTLIQKLQGRFPNHELMLTFGVIYFNFWANDVVDAKDNFHQHTIVVKAIYYNSCKVGKDGLWMKLYLMVIL